ncbi:hypothetical protein F4821DRAFT_105174 [Hypoxylon rubiginosum]|uniref:Uncharacterized protein n=1 Tax=Hypoxylon rubiginosum TaxID=110542 RepID=A0ACC0D4N2_9PEZI|nr:hypothetical protein F4821DRAFT_105174 [Hypoxylon rubiginosum]
MPFYHGRVACKAIPSTDVTIIVAAYDADGQLRTTALSSNNQHMYDCADAPDEGIFIEYQDRALQIAAPPCDQRMCKGLCSCDRSYCSTKINSRQTHLNRKKGVWWKPCHNCLVDWMRLYPAAEAAHKLGMQFLRHPRTLTSVESSDGYCSFHYDGELEEATIRSNHNGGRSQSAIACPEKLFEWIMDTWNKFTASGCHKPDCVIALSDSDASSKRKSSSDDSEWDDLDIPCKVRRQSRQVKSTGEFDCINDLIEEGEFPRLRKCCSAKSVAGPREKGKANQSQADDDNDDSSSQDGGDPVPVIIPPKNMRIGKGLSRQGSEVSLVTNSSRTYPQRSLSNKRSHGNFAESSGLAEQQPAENSPRMAKYQKRGFSGLRAVSGRQQQQRRQGPAVLNHLHNHNPMSLFGRKLLFV